MKFLIFRFTTLLFCLVLFSACDGDQNTANISDENEEIKRKKSSSDPTTQVDELEAEEITQLRDSVEKVKTAISPFISEGCCGEEERKEESCCCEAVYEAYKSMLEKDNPDVVDIGMTDPILAKCRRLMPTEFDKLENPPSTEPDELDDLFN
ncbi:MAG TPA: hypothetical protein VJ894_02530 [Cryomorphaceae bacterium]|nr:hypothetical protein [Cryomorphaceae bacterium]